VSRGAGSRRSIGGYFPAVQAQGDLAREIDAPRYRDLVHADAVVHVGVRFVFRQSRPVADCNAGMTAFATRHIGSLFS
jgi:hypothetical protein